MNTIYIIIHGLTTCSDNDTILAFVEDESRAKEIAEELNKELPDGSSYKYFHEPVEKWE